MSKIEHISSTNFNNITADIPTIGSALTRAGAVLSADLTTLSSLVTQPFNFSTPPTSTSSSFSYTDAALGTVTITGSGLPIYDPSSQTWMGTGTSTNVTQIRFDNSELNGLFASIKGSISGKSISVTEISGGDQYINFKIIGKLSATNLSAQEPTISGSLSSLTFNIKDTHDTIDTSDDDNYQIFIGIKASTTAETVTINSLSIYDSTASGTETLLNLTGLKFAIGANDDMSTIDFFSGNDQVTGTDSSDFLDVSKGNDKLFGFGGDDILIGGEGNDTIDGGAGNDQIWGDNVSPLEQSTAGNDKITDTSGNNWINAGDGNNSVITGDGDDTIYAGNGNDKIAAGAGTNVIDAGDGNNVVTTLEGNDTITTGSGNDKITAGAGNNVIHAGDGNDTVTTLAGNDVIFGGAGMDKISAGAGDDMIYGGAGADKLTGGLGADVFVFDTLPVTGQADTITDFVKGTDKLAFDTSVFTALAGLTADNFSADYHLVYDGKGKLYYDANGGDHADMVQIVGVKGLGTTLEYSDLILISAA